MLTPWKLRHKENKLFYRWINWKITKTQNCTWSFIQFLNRFWLQKYTKSGSKDNNFVTSIWFNQNKRKSYKQKRANMVENLHYVSHDLAHQKKITTYLLHWIKPMIPQMGSRISKALGMHGKNPLFESVSMNYLFVNWIILLCTIYYVRYIDFC